MKHIIDFFTNYILMSGICAWLIAQILKIPAGLFRQKKFSFRAVIFGNGGMPSSHSATVCAISCAALLRDGAASASFGICCVIAIIVMNDAIGVRWETGEQAKILNRLVKELPEEERGDFPEKLKEVVGHTPGQVLVGAVLGILVAIGLHFIPAFGLEPFFPKA